MELKFTQFIKKHSFFNLIVIYIVAIIIGLAVALIFRGQKIYAVIFYVIVLLGVISYIKCHKCNWRPWLLMPHTEGVTRIIVSTLAMILLTLFLVAIRTALWKEGIIDTFEFNLYVFIASCIMAPIIEEIVCRGIVVDILREKHSNVFTIVVSAFIFYIIHGNLFNISSLFFGFLAGWMVVKCKSVIPGMIIHVTWNGVIFFLPVIANTLADKLNY